MTEEIANGSITLEQVGKVYLLRKQKPFLAKEVFDRLFRRGKPRWEHFSALTDVSFTIKKGEALAIVGRNGAGKSTMLGLIAGTVYPTHGRVDVQGRIGALLELGAGFHPDLTGRENIFLNASLLGLQKDEVEAKLDQIIEFSGLTDFIDAPLRNYSSGMQVRLGFSVAAHIDPDIVLMDEVFAVGDAEFVHKCMKRVMEFKSQSKTLLFVTHGAEMLRGICDRAIWLDHGHVQADGPFGEVLQQYAAACR
jgi:homopolymeric O-antigen transport system ATP-binding protein